MVGILQPDRPSDEAIAKRQERLQDLLVADAKLWRTEGKGRDKAAFNQAAHACWAEAVVSGNRPLDWKKPEDVTAPAEPILFSDLLVWERRLILLALANASAFAQAAGFRASELGDIG